MSQTQREWITATPAPLQRSYGVVAVSPLYEVKRIGGGYVIAHNR